MLPAPLQVPLTGSYNSASLRGWPGPAAPPATRTLPSLSRTAAAPVRAVSMGEVAVQVRRPGSKIVALLTAPFASAPPATRTRSSLNRVAVAPASAYGRAGSLAHELLVVWNSTALLTIGTEENGVVPTVARPPTTSNEPSASATAVAEYCGAGIEGSRPHVS